MKLKRNTSIKKRSKKRMMSTQINLSNSWPRSWGHDHFIKKNHETQFLTNPMMKDEIKKKNLILKKDPMQKKKNENQIWNKNIMTGHLSILARLMNPKEKREKKGWEWKVSLKHHHCSPPTCDALLGIPRHVVLNATKEANVRSLKKNARATCTWWLPPHWNVWCKR